MKTKEERAREVVNKVYSFVYRFVTVVGYVNVAARPIVVDFIGEFEGKPAKTRVLCRNRQQAAKLLVHFRKAKDEVMDWVKFVVISNVRSGPVKNSKGEWRKRPRVLEFRIKNEGMIKEVEKIEEKEDIINKNEEFKLVNEVKIEVIEQTKEDKEKIKKEWDKWIAVGEYEVNWSRKEYKYKGGVVKKFRSKMKMLSKLINQPKLEEVKEIEAEEYMITDYFKEMEEDIKELSIQRFAGATDRAYVIKVFEKEEGVQRQIGRLVTTNALDQLNFITEAMKKGYSIEASVEEVSKSEILCKELGRNMIVAMFDRLALSRGEDINGNYHRMTEEREEKLEEAIEALDELYDYVIMRKIRKEYRNHILLEVSHIKYLLK